MSTRGNTCARMTAARLMGRGGVWGGTAMRFAFSAGLLAVSAAGCGEQQPAPWTTDVESNGNTPVADAYLDRAFPATKGLLNAVDAQGYPLLTGPDVDPMIVEARRFYDTLGRPVPTGATRPADDTAPLSFAEWKTTFGFAEREPGEDIAAWRLRAGVVVYYNQYELGLGRELGCSRFDDGVGPDGNSQTGVACFVTNYGAAFSDQHNSMGLAVEGENPKNTVCISYRPSLGVDYEVQFYVYGHDGARQDWAQLDTMGPRPHPQVCTNCHGGFYNQDRGLVKRARFLPMDPNLMIFADAPATTTRAAQEERIRVMNALAMTTPLTEAQRGIFAGLYGGQADAPGRSAAPYVPDAWTDTPAHADLYRLVVKPACGTCHLAIDKTAADASSAFYGALASPQAFAGSGAIAYMCTFQMPNAQATMNAFWRTQTVTIGTKTYNSMADALLSEFASGPGTCSTLPVMTDCRRAPDPDCLCGDQHSGTACDVTSGRCIPVLGPFAPANPASPTGICKMDGTRVCPWPLECQPTDFGLSGYDGACYSCGGMGRRACLTSPPCADGLVQSPEGICLAATSTTTNFK